MQRILFLPIIILFEAIFLNCTSTDTEETENKTDDWRDELPGMETHDVSMLVSDSGVIRYHALTPLWLRYNLNPKNAYWYFPKGIELQQLDDSLLAIGHISADTAYHYEREQQWRLVGHVNIHNAQGERFLTEELYWDMRQHSVYSDSFIHIERKGDILEGYGFRSNEQFTRYELRQTTGIFSMQHPASRPASSSLTPSQP